MSRKGVRQEVEGDYREHDDVTRKSSPVGLNPPNRPNSLNSPSNQYGRSHMTSTNSITRPAQRRKIGKQTKIKMHYSLACGVHHIEFIAMVHELRNGGILPELVYE
jgi:hypothetical protein